MRTRVTIVLAIGLALLCLLASTTTATAQGRPIPDPANSSCAWNGPALVICPAADGPSSVVVSVRDAANVPIVGETVTISYVAGCDACFCPPFTTTTDPAGVAVFYPAGGLDRSVDPDCCDVTTVVTCMGVTIPWTGTGLTFDTREWRSVDLDGDCIVGPADLAIFTADFGGGSACRSDFDGDGLVALLDFAIFQMHMSHQCDPTVPEPDIDIDPTYLEFTLPPGGTDCEPFTISNVGDADLIWDVAETCPWVTLDPLSGTTGPAGSDDVEVCVDATGLSSGGHYCEITVTSNDPDEPTLVVTVYLDVVQVPDIGASPTSFTFDLQVGFQECDVLTISNSGIATLNWDIDGGATWLTYTPGSGSIPASGSTDVDICVNSSGLTPGAYTVDLDLTSNDPDTPVIVIDVTLNVLPTPEIDVTPTALDFVLWQGEVECQELTIANTGTGTLDWLSGEPCSWLTVAPVAGSVAGGGSQIVDVCADATGLDPGNFDCTVTIGHNDPHAAPVTVPVTLTVLPTPDIEIYPPGGTTSPGAETQVEVTVDAMWAYPPGAYNWFLYYNSNDPDEPQVDVPVYVTILAAPQATFDPPEFIFEVGAGGSGCSPLEISNTGSGDLVWTLSDECDWLAAIPDEGTTPPGESSTVEVCVNAAGLVPGTYECDLVLETNEPGRATYILPVTLYVLPPLPDIDVTPTSLSFHIVGNHIECDELEIENLGFANLNWTLTEACPWLVATPGSGMTRPGMSKTIRVCANSAGLMTGVYNCNIEIASDDPDEPLVTIPVTLSVQIPSMANSHVDWVNLGCAGKVFVCPQSDGTAITISVRDTNDNPIEGAQVVPFFDGTCEGCMCEPISVLTGPLGTATMGLYGGIDASASPDCCVITTTMYIGGQAIPWLGTGLPDDTREYISPDLNGDCVVNLSDNAIFTMDFGTDACRTDYDCDGFVTAIDFATFGLHMNHSCMPPVSDIEEEEIEPQVSALEQNYPNPFNPVTKIAFTVTEAGRVVLQVFDAAGRPVRTLADALMVASRYELVWDGTDDRGRQVGSGVYFYRLEIAGKLETRKMVLLK